MVTRPAFFEPQAERATYDSVAFRYIVVNTHPDNDTIASFHERVESCIYVDTGDGASDGTAESWGNQSGWHKVKANKHKAISYGYVQRFEFQLNEEVLKLLLLAVLSRPKPKTGWHGYFIGVGSP